MKTQDTETTDLQKREQDVVFKIAKLCGHKTYMSANGKVIRYSVFQDGYVVANMYFDSHHPFSGNGICNGMQLYLNEYASKSIHGQRDYLNEFAFPAWLKDASLEEVELRLAAMGI